MTGTHTTNERRIGTVVPVGALRGKESIGVGEYLDLPEFGAFCAKMGVGLIQLLPVNDTGYESSPYSALTAFGLHPLYVRIHALPEAASAGDRLTDRLAAIRAEYDGARRVPYYRLLNAKMSILQDLYTTNEADIRARTAAGGPLASWMARHPWVREYAAFRTLKAANDERSWVTWTTHRHITAKDLDALWNDEAFARKARFWVWLQEALDTQFSQAAAALRDQGIILEGDLPILMNEDSCDVWAHPAYFDRRFSAGAPPDMYSPKGQNWGFPVYHWPAHAQDGYAWWRNRLQVAAQYYGAYRIDHVLGFFRIWAASRDESSALLGRYHPYCGITGEELARLGFDEGRIRWMSVPHIPTQEVWDSLSGIPDERARNHEADRVFSTALNRVGDEELWWFKDTIHGERDITRLNLHPAATASLLNAWANRLFLEYAGDSDPPGACPEQKTTQNFFPVWYYEHSRAWASLSPEERDALERLFEEKQDASEDQWEEQGLRLLGILAEASPMLPCAEDLGAVPGCVPRVLEKLRILGLRVVRWTREWSAEHQPYVPFKEYPELSVCTSSVHDSSTLREWWDREAAQGDEQDVFSGFLGLPSLPRVYNPGTAKIILGRIARAASRFRVFPIQDLLHLSLRWYTPDCSADRINVPGTANDFNWTYRLPAPISELAADRDLVNGVLWLSLRAAEPA